MGSSFLGGQFAPSSHCVDQLADKSHRIDLIVVLARGKAKQLCAKCRIPGGLGRNNEPMEGHAAPDRLSANSLVETGRENPSDGVDSFCDLVLKWRLVEWAA